MRVYIANANPESVCRSASLEFGGATVTQGTGGWIDPETGTFYQEPVCIVEIITELLEGRVSAWALRYARILGEKSVLVVYDNGDNSFLSTGA